MSREEAPLVLETPGGLSVRYRGRLLYSGREPARLPRRIAAACDRGPARLHLVPSPLLWYGVRELLSSMGPRSAVLCVEADPALASLARSRLPRELAGDERLAFVECSSPEEAAEAARRLGSFRACAYEALSGGESLNAPTYKNMAAAIAAEFESEWRNRAALMILGERWARNLFDNIAALPEIAPARFPRFPGAVAVCGAGPSLEDALPLLHASRPGLGIVACDTALGTLLSAGIEPDLVVCLEGQAHNLADFTCLGSRGTPLAADLSSQPATFRAVSGPKFLTLVRITRSRFLERVEAALSGAGIRFLPCPPLGSVGVHALRLARELAVGPVLATGLDFCFEAGKTHSRGSPSLLAEERSSCRLRRWPGQYSASFRERCLPAPCAPLRDGRRLLSDPVLLSYAALLSRTASGPGPKVLDIRGRGIGLGLPSLDQGEAAFLLASLPAREEAPAAEAARGEVNGSAAREAMAAFLEGEARLLGALRLALRGGGSLDAIGLRRLVSEADYLYWCFPDADRAEESPQDFLNRLVPKLEWWDWRVRELAASLARA